MPPKEKALSANKTEKVGCRVCKETVAWQNYECHLKRFHPSEDPKDRRAFGEQKLTFNKSRKVEEEKAKGDGNENNNEDNDGPAGGVKRARHEDTEQHGAAGEEMEAAKERRKKAAQGWTPMRKASQMKRIWRSSRQQ